jgi:1,2-diacylglycerol 3-beta-glucosyltransferase
MGTRVAAALTLLFASGIAWLAVSAPIVARALQALIIVSMAYVAWLAWRGWRVMRGALRAPSGGAEHETSVSLIVPARDEERSIAATIRCLVELRHVDGRTRHDVLVVDDGSTDRTEERARSAVRDAPGITIVRREAGDGPRTKGAVLAWATPKVRGDIVGVVDADSRVAPDFLVRVLDAWQRDPGAAALQVARRPRNAARSWLTRAQEEEQLMDLTSQCGRWATDGSAELRGNGMFVRRTVLDAVGGWNPTALTEDLDLSTRLAAAGHRIAMAPEIPIDEEAVEAIGPLWRQRVRWAEGSLRRLLEHGPGLVAGDQPLKRKLDFLAFAAEFAVPPLFAATVVAGLITIPLPQAADWTVPASLGVGYAVGICALALGGLHAMGERGLTLAGRAVRGSLFLSHWLVVVPLVLAWIAVGPTTSGFRQTPRFLED